MDVSTSGTELPRSMKAWRFERSGTPDVLVLRDCPLPSFRDDHEVLVRVRAASVNPVDRHALKPPLIFRRGQGFLRPKEGRLGADFSGEVVVAGEEVKEPRVGDAVYGVGRGTFAEYAVADETQVVVKPTQLSFEQAAAVPIAAVTALQGLRDKAGVQPGQKVLINGASGGVGTFAIQIAKALGAEVTAVCSAPNAQQARSLGADRVFDYSKEDFTQSGERYDLIFDTQLNHPLKAYRRSLSPNGLLLMVGAGPGSTARILGRLLRTSMGARIVGPRAKFFVASVKKEPLNTLTEWLAAGRVTPSIDRRFPLSQVPDACRYLINGHARGKIIIAN
jgi:NADPH:quinone reductase-like Zn-dependent oxidoreductase